jgi:hypothetical protein
MKSQTSDKKNRRDALDMTDAEAEAVKEDYGFMTARELANVFDGYRVPRCVWNSVRADGFERLTGQEASETFQEDADE